MGWTKEGRSCLEMALRGGRSDLVNFAFNLDSLYYDSAALCAAVVSITKQKSQITSQFQQLMRRRELMLESEHPRVVPQLEITALSIALFYQRADLLTLIHRAEFAKVASVLSTSTQALIDMVNFRPPHRKAYIMDLESKLDKCLSRSAAWESSSPIYWALLGNFLEIIPKLLESGYQSDAMTLCLAIRHKLPSSVLELLVAACDNIDSHHSFVPTALQFAVQHGSLELVKMLLQRGANPNATPVEGKRLASADALALAIERGDVQLVAILISAGANINQPPSQNQGIAALQAAAIFGQIEILRSLLSNRAEINARRAYFDGRTALEGAAENGRLDTVQLLLDYGVDTDQKGRVQYIRATVFAHRMGYAAVERVLRAHRSWTEKDENIW
ncbi:ankyrin, partial [Hyaloscypha variabilis F]